MADFLWQVYHRLISQTNYPVRRFLYDQLNSDRRLTGVVGPRGVGKTTLLLQYIKDNYYKDGTAFYFSADQVYFSEVSILEFVDNLYNNHGVRVVFIDEIHQYNNWSQELKNIYDSFPDIKVIFSGSSSIDLISGSYDLSRRAHLLELPGLSFREYLNIKLGESLEVISFVDLINNHQQIAASLTNITTLMQHFLEYMSFGYYPTVFESRDDLYQAVSSIIDKSVYEDIANFYSLKTGNLNYFKRIINFLATIPPGSIKVNNLARHLGIDNKTVDNYINILERTGMVKSLYPVAVGNQVLTKFDKIYLDNTTLLAAMNSFLSNQVDVGSQRELAFLQFVKGANLSVFFPKVGDFQINDIIFEVGGPNKTKGQFTKSSTKTKEKIYLVKDKILLGSKFEIPLYLFGFLY
jgi:uncharacterized protein